MEAVFRSPFNLDILKKETIRDVQRGLDIATKEFGRYGTLHLFLVDIDDPKAKDLAIAYCNSKQQVEIYVDEVCVKEKAEEFSRCYCCSTAHDPAEHFAEVRYQSVGYSGSNISSDEGRLVATAVHEYVHVF